MGDQSGIGGNSAKIKFSKGFFVLVLILVIVTNAITGVAMYFTGRNNFLPAPVERNLLSIDYNTNDDHTALLAQNLIYYVVEIRADTSAGTGIIMKYDENGYPIIVTNFHVISKSPHAASDAYSDRDIYVRLYSSLIYSSYGKVQVLGFDEYNDVAVLRLNAAVRKDALDGAKSILGDSSSLVIGQRVLAMGNALAHGLSVFEGIVSNRDVVIGISSKKVPVIQTTAPINGGNSGGAMFDMAGKLIGMNTYQAVTNGDKFVDSIGYAVPINIVHAVYNSIMDAPYSSLTANRLRKAKLFDINILYDIYVDSKVECEQLKCNFMRTAEIVGGEEIQFIEVYDNTGIIFADGDRIVQIGDHRLLTYEDGGKYSFDVQFSSLLAEFLKYKPGAAATEKLEIKIIRDGRSLSAASEELKSISGYKKIG